MDIIIIDLTERSEQIEKDLINEGHQVCRVNSVKEARDWCDEQQKEQKIVLEKTMLIWHISSSFYENKEIDADELLDVIKNRIGSLKNIKYKYAVSDKRTHRLIADESRLFSVDAFAWMHLKRFLYEED